MTRYGGRATSLGLVAGGLVVVAGVAMLATVFLGRPGVSVSSSGAVLVQVHLSGVGTELTGLSATSQGRPVALVRDGDGLVPAARTAPHRAWAASNYPHPPPQLRSQT
jgi:hypothetical protein